MEKQSDSDSSSDPDNFIEKCLMIKLGSSGTSGSSIVRAARAISKKCKGRTPGARTFRRGACSWYNDYLSSMPVYSSSKFREVFRVPLKLYWRLHSEILAYDLDFLQTKDAFGKTGHSSHQKILCCLRRLGNGLSFSQLDDMPTTDELRSVVQGYEEAGFPGCMGCIDCMHLHWKNCPKALKGQHHNPNDGKLATISCEALEMEYTPLGHLYPAQSCSSHERESHMTKRQEAVRKDVERFFGCLQGRFKILRQERHECSDSSLMQISSACVILHNMVVKMVCDGVLDGEEADSDLVQEFFDLQAQNEGVGSGCCDAEDHATGLTQLLARNRLVTNRVAHVDLTEALAHHLWNIAGS
eukprot:IDg6951t1